MNYDCPADERTVTVEIVFAWLPRRSTSERIVVWIPGFVLRCVFDAVRDARRKRGR